MGNVVDGLLANYLLAEAWGASWSLGRYRGGGPGDWGQAVGVLVGGLYGTYGR